MTSLEGLLKSQEVAFSVIPAEAGIQGKQALLDPGFRRGDSFGNFLQTHPVLKDKIKSLGSRYLLLVTHSLHFVNHGHDLAFFKSPQVQSAGPA